MRLPLVNDGRLLLVQRELTEAVVSRSRTWPGNRPTRASSTSCASRSTPPSKKDAFLIDQLSTPLSKNGTNAFYRKQGNQPRHVSIDVGGAENWWLAELKKLKRAA
jgi:hypothetical protein